jgi:integrase
MTKWCFPSPKDITKPVSNAFRFFYDRMREYSGMPEVQVRDFRRTFITRSASKTADIHAVSQIVRHSDISITARVYDQVDDQRQRKALKLVQKDLALID